MASPFARIIAQLAVASAGIVSRAFVSAYSQAVHSEFVCLFFDADSCLHRTDRDHDFRATTESVRRRTRAVSGGVLLLSCKWGFRPLDNADWCLCGCLCDDNLVLLYNPIGIDRFRVLVAGVSILCMYLPFFTSMFFFRACVRLLRDRSPTRHGPVENDENPPAART